MELLPTELLVIVLQLNDEVPTLRLVCRQWAKICYNKLLLSGYEITYNEYYYNYYCRYFYGNTEFHDEDSPRRTVCNILSGREGPFSRSEIESMITNDSVYIKQLLHHDTTNRKPNCGPLGPMGKVGKDGIPLALIPINREIERRKKELEQNDNKRRRCRIIVICLIVIAILLKYI